MILDKLIRVYLINYKPNNLPRIAYEVVTPSEKLPFRNPDFARHPTLSLETQYHIQNQVGKQYGLTIRTFLSFVPSSLTN